MKATVHGRTMFMAAGSLIAIASAPAYAQAAKDNDASGNDIIVTAQRVEQRLQDVPISITVLSQSTLSNNNVSSAKDLVNYTPGLTVNNRYGADSTTFSIRGFTQDQRTTATVGTYFADVVAPRGSGATFGGDGAGPGSLFDLQNIQVLKGPQGTLFGRNSTGGAVLLVPNKPTHDLEGYVEGSTGNYDMYRVQAVLNLPISENFRIRAGVDRQKRDGYLRNIGRVGDGRFGNHGMGDLDYWAGRLSAIIDITPDLENYTVASFTHSQNNGTIGKIGVDKDIYQCDPTRVQFLDARGNNIPFGAMACAQAAREQAAGFWTVSNRLPDAQSVMKQWQVINTTTWQASDSITIKNNLSYGKFHSKLATDLFGTYFIRNGVTPGAETVNDLTGFAFTHPENVSGYTNAQSSMVEELQLQGHPEDGRLTWQLGAYTEINKPLGFSGVNTGTLSACPDITVLNCTPFTPGFSLGSGQYQLSKTKFSDYALYGQASYNLTDKLKLTGGIRYTWDKQTSDLRIETITFGSSVAASTAICTNFITSGDTGPSPFPLANRASRCNQRITQSTSAPTWLLGLDYKPVDAILLYAKWSRGYRQGGISFFGPDPIQKYDAEKVDTYEIGAKTQWRGSVPGYFNIAAYTNNFKNQQLLLGISCTPSKPNYTVPCAGNAGVVNAASSKLKGFEAEFGITLADRIHLGAAYSYISTKIAEFTPPTLPPGLYNDVTSPLSANCTGVEFCNTVPGTVPHKLSLTASVDLPIPESAGKLTLGATMIYTSRFRNVADNTPAFRSATLIPGTSRTETGLNSGVLPGSKVFNLTANWTDIGGMPIDASVFVTNVTNEHVYLQVNDSIGSRGFNSYLIGEPRMYGIRLKYRFGS